MQRTEHGQGPAKEDGIEDNNWRLLSWSSENTNDRTERLIRSYSIDDVLGEGARLIPRAIMMALD